MVDKSRTDGSGHIRKDESPLGLPRWVVAVLPVVLLLLVAGLLVATAPLSGVQAGQPLPDLTITHVEIPNTEVLVIHVVNNGPEPVTISQVLIDEAYWEFRVEGAGGDRTLAPLQGARVVVPYHTTPGWDFEIALLTAGGATFHHTIVAANTTPGVTLGLLWTLALVGVFVGVIPVALGMLWYPFIRSMSDRRLHAVLAFAAGLLIFLAFDAGLEALEISAEIPGFLGGQLLVVLGALGALLVVQAVSAWRDGRAAAGDARADSGLWLAYLVALGIGLHNLAEGLAIGSAFALGRVALGTFLLVGFMLHNVTEGPAVVAPVARDRRPSGWHFAALGALAGAPVILGGWIGSLAYSPTLGALFLAIGVGAILQVVWELTKLVRADADRAATATNLVAFGVGIALMYATDLIVAL